MGVGRENFFWHKLHSLTGVIPIGFYMIQHLTLNSFSVAGPEKFNGVIAFFESVPKHLLLVLEVFVLGIPILFHGVYGLFISSRADFNVARGAYPWRENWMFTMQRISGIALFLLLIAHVATTTINSKINGPEVIQWQAWHDKLTSYGYVILIVYMIGVLLASYHLCYGLWNFCIRWGITISGRSQRAMQQVSAVAFVAVTLLGWLALYGFVHNPGPSASDGPVEVRAGGSALAMDRPQLH